MQNYHKDEALRLLKWISAHPREWRDICGQKSGFITADRYLELMNMLREESFYQLMMVFMSTAQEEFPLDDYFAQLALERIIDQWPEGSAAKMLHYLLTEMLAETRIIEERRKQDAVLKGLYE